MIPLDCNTLGFLIELAFRNHHHAAMERARDCDDCRVIFDGDNSLLEFLANAVNIEAKMSGNRGGQPLHLIV